MFSFDSILYHTFINKTSFILLRDISSRISYIAMSEYSLWLFPFGSDTIRDVLIILWSYAAPAFSIKIPFIHYTTTS